MATGLETAPTDIGTAHLSATAGAHAPGEAAGRLCLAVDDLGLLTHEDQGRVVVQEGLLVGKDLVPVGFGSQHRAHAVAAIEPDLGRAVEIRLRDRQVAVEGWVWM